LRGGKGGTFIVGTGRHLASLRHWLFGPSRIQNLPASLVRNLRQSHVVWWHACLCFAGQLKNETSRLVLEFRFFFTVCSVGYPHQSFSVTSLTKLAYFGPKRPAAIAAIVG